jgi:TRAP-type C4-dicarboxylate transport system permease small subunit
MYTASISLVGLLVFVIYGVIMRYVFNNAPPYVEQLALLLVISVAMFGASAGVRDAGHIGLDSLVNLLSLKSQLICKLVVYLLTICFAISLLVGGVDMAISTYSNTIPTLGFSESLRYIPVISAGLLITLFSIEHIVALSQSKKVIPSWH